MTLAGAILVVQEQNDLVRFGFKSVLVAFKPNVLEGFSFLSTDTFTRLLVLTESWSVLGAVQLGSALDLGAVWASVRTSQSPGAVLHSVLLSEPDGPDP